MSVLIKGMELPESCWDCPLYYDYLQCSVDPTISNNEECRDERCPLIKTPERKRGKWLYEGMIEKTWKVYTCSLCSGKCIDGGAYCPNCGAQMDGDSDV